MPLSEIHPWLNDFRIDLREVSIQLWHLLGQAVSKCKHISGVPLKPATAADLNGLYLAKGVQATVAIEGNTLTEKQVQALLNKQLELPISQEYLATEAQNILEACNDIRQEIIESFAQGQTVDMTVEWIKAYNEKILRNTPLKEDVIPGQLRTHSVGVGRYLAPEAKSCPLLLERYCDWYARFSETTELDKKLDKQSAAIFKAIIAHLFFVWIHPFGDGNGRTARLIELKTLLEAGLPVSVSHLLSNHYNFTRSEYYVQLDRASSTQNVGGFLIYALQGFLDNLDEHIARIREQQFAIAWESFVYERFSGKDSPADTRRRHLVLDLSYQAEPVKKNQFPDISPRLAAAYAQKTPKTVSRDLKVLQEMHLVRKKSNGYVANKEIIFAFLSVTAAEIEY